MVFHVDKHAPGGRDVDRHGTKAVAYAQSLSALIAVSILKMHDALAQLVCNDTRRREAFAIDVDGSAVECVAALMGGSAFYFVNAVRRKQNGI